ncbi:MAG TPA: molybdopterin cofactor-binding domain-containing protein [Candidatus Acidoferrales bacterium]|nr:molybdopterin cofactor-binding domain-containing protein [Candidatus Acidoferrales bacterium]
MSLNDISRNMESPLVSRRSVLKGAGALVVYFNIFDPLTAVLAQESAEPEAASLDSWLAVDRNGIVTVFTSKVDLGTGVETALGQIVAEELDIPFSHIRMEVGDTTKTVDQGITAGSRTIERAGPQLRQASAAARQQLLKMASSRLGVPAEELVVSDGIVSAPGTAKKISYGELVGGKPFNVHIAATGEGWDLKVAPDVRAKNPNDYKIVGTSVPRVDLPPKFTAQFTYTQDVHVPGMLHGRVVRPATVAAKPASIDEDSVKNIPGVVKIVREGSFVAVVAESEWAAIQAAKGLKVTWTTPQTKLPANADAVYDYLENTKSFANRPVVNRGNTDQALAGASKKYEATFRWPFQMHGMLAPSCAVADVRGNKAIIWVPSQGPFDTRARVAKLLGIPEEQIQVIYREASGCYGRLGTDDAAEDAVVMSRAVGKPVRVQWSREDEHGWEPKGPAQLLTVRAGVDANGKVVAWDFLDRSFPWTEANGIPLVTSRQLGLHADGQGMMNGSGGGGDTYTFENQKIIAAAIPWVQPDPTPLRTSPLRAPGDLARVFASESFMDELAAGQGEDGLKFRLRYAAPNKRATDALTAVGKLANWQERPSPAREATGDVARGRGIAISARSTTVVAAVAEVEVNKSTGAVSVKKVSVAHDCGLVINPDGLKNQIEGNVIQGTSRALMEEVKYDSSGIKNLDWASYPILRYEDIPNVEITLIDRKDMPALGGGEPSIGPIPAAIANAIFDAIGARLREAPFTPERVLKAMRSA